MLEEKVTLREYMTAYPEGLGAKEAARILLPVAQALQQLHYEGALHLQINPDRISVTQEGCTLGNPSLSESDRYIYGFTAPEVYKHTTLCSATDVYSFCAVLYYVACGKVPEPSLALEEQGRSLCPVDLAAPDFVNLVNAGTASNAETRISDMEQVVQSLCFCMQQEEQPAVTDPVTVSVPEPVQPIMPPVTPANYGAWQTVPKKKSKTGLKLLVAVLAVLVVLVGTYAGTYLAAYSAAAKGDAAKASSLLPVRQVTALHDPQLAKYADAADLMEKGEYKAAEEAFKELGSYMDCYDKADDAAFLHGEQLLEDGYYSAANELFRKLEKKNHDGAAQMEKESRYCWALALSAEGKTKEAYDKMSELGSYSDASYRKDQLAGQLYREAVGFYSQGRLESAKEAFLALGRYKDSSKYLTLIKAATATAPVSDALIEELKAMLAFENTAEVLMSNQEVAQQFLLGKWRGDGRYLEMKSNGDITYDIPWIEFGDYYRIEQGKFLLFKEGQPNDTQMLFAIKVIDANCVKFYSYKNNKTYIMYRQ